MVEESKNLYNSTMFPLIRIDDYPTGIRPIPENMSLIHAILLKFETAQLPYYLGIVPAILTPEMIKFLTQLSVMIPAMHGIDHDYPTLSKKLIKIGDPSNKKGKVTVHNQFRWHRYRSIVIKLTHWKTWLETKLNLPVTTYIPPNNQINLKTVAALKETGFTLCLSETTLPNSPIPMISSDFYGFSNHYSVKGPEKKVITLHTNWEADLIQSGDTTSLDRLIAEIKSLHFPDQVSKE